MRQVIPRRHHTKQVAAVYNGSSSAFLPAAQAGDFDFTEAFTLEANVFITTLTNAYLISKYSFTGNQRQYSVNFFSGDLFLNVSADGSGIGANFMQFRLNLRLRTLREYHIAVHFDTATDTAIFYVDGAVTPNTLTSAGNLTAPMAAGTAAFVVGGQENAGTLQNKLVGKMWDVRAWNRVRTATQIRDNRYALDNDRDGLMGRYFVDSPSLIDLSGRNNHLNMDGTITFEESERAVITDREIVTGRQCT